MATKFSWGHINVNVSDLDRSVAFYRKLGFEIFLPGIPYLNLSLALPASVDPPSGQALGIPATLQGRACIMQLNDGFPKLDLTEFVGIKQASPVENKDLGLVRLCLSTEDLQADYEALSKEGVEFLSPPALCHERLADVAVCMDPDGTCIELLQVYLERWGPYLS